MSLILLHPKVAAIDCKDCWLHQYDDGKPKLFRGLSLPRYKNTPPPCTLRDSKGRSKCPKGTPDAYSDLTLPNKLALVHYQQCKAVGEFPDDAIVKRNAGIIGGIERQQEQLRHHEFSVLLRAALQTRG